MDISAIPVRSAILCVSLFLSAAVTETLTLYEAHCSVQRWHILLTTPDATQFYCSTNGDRLFPRIGTDSMGAMGAIAPTAKKLWGRCPEVAAQELCYVNFREIQKGR